MSAVRQLLLESLMLSSLGGAVGLALAAGAIRLAPRILPVDLPRLEDLALDSRVFFFAGNYQEYEANKRERLGEEAAKPKRIRYRPLTIS